jgi:hypothetical protein
MPYFIGDVEMQGNQPIDAHNVIRVAFTPKTTDGGKARIKRRREHMRMMFGEPVIDKADDILMHPVDTSPSEMNPAQAD